MATRQQVDDALIAMQNLLRGEMQQELQALGNRNQQLEQANITARTAAVDAANRITAMEAALRDGGHEANGGGGPRVNAAAGHADLGGGPVPPRPPMNPRMPTITFSGGENDDFLSFRTSFVNYALFSGFSDLQARRALLGSTRGAAFLSVQNINHEDNNMTVDNVLDLYEARFCPPAASDLARCRFETATQGPTESLLQWHGRLQLLHARAYGNAGGAGIADAALMIRAFARGIRVRKIREHCLRSQPQTYDQALQFSQTEQAVIDSGSYVPGSVPFASNIGGHPQRQGGGRGRQDEPMEIGQLGSHGKEKLKCHNCSAYGHFSRDCPQPRKVPKGVVAGAGPPRFKRPVTGAEVATDKKEARLRKFFTKKHINEIHEALQEIDENVNDYEEEEEEEELEEIDPGAEEEESSTDETRDF